MLEIDKLKNENATLRAKLGRTLLRQRLVDEAVRRGMGTNAANAADLALVGHKGEIDDEGNASSFGGTPIAAKDLVDSFAKIAPEVFARMQAHGGAGGTAHAPRSSDELEGMSSSQLLARGFAEQSKAADSAHAEGAE